MSVIDKQERADRRAAQRADVAALDRLDPRPASVNDVKKRMGWGSDRATDALRGWRSRSAGTPQDPEDHTVPHSSTPVSGPEERTVTCDETNTCRRCYAEIKPHHHLCTGSTADLMADATAAS